MRDEASPVISLGYGEEVDVSNFELYKRFLVDRERYPLFVRGLEKYLEDNLGEDWPLILLMGREVLSKGKWSGSIRTLKYLGKHGPFAHNYHLEEFVNCPSDGGIGETTFRVTPFLNIEEIKPANV